MLQPWLVIVFKVVGTLWLGVVSIWDLRERRIPNWLVMPVMLVALGWQIYSSAAHHTRDVVFVLVAWVVVFLLWQVGVWGGGDAKLLMGLMAMFPTQSFLLLFCLCVRAVTLPVLLVKVAVGLWRRLRHEANSPGEPRERIWPSRDKLRDKGRAYAWAFALPGVIYVWLLF